VKVVDAIVTEKGWIQVGPEGLDLQEIAPGLTPEQVQAATEPRLIISPELKEMKI
jgi:acyl CoA:acetate/3-ketoacid CoA transferase beta subunit